MSAWVVAMVFASTAVGAGFWRLRRVQQAVSFDLDALRRALGPGADAARLRALRAALEPEDPSWEAELVAGLADESTPRGRTALMNEALHDAAQLLGWGRQISRAAPRWAAAGPLCVLFWTLARQTLSMWDALPVITWAAAGVIASLALAHEANRLVARQRRSIDGWVDQLLITASLR
jgi:hypothetical protein